MPQVQQLLLANGFPFPCYACSWRSDSTNLLQTNTSIVCVTRMKSVTAEVWQDLAHFKRLRTSHHMKPTSTPGIQLAVYRHCRHTNMCKKSEARQITGWFIPHNTPTELSNLHYCTIQTPSPPSKVEHAKAIAPFKLHSHPVWYGQKVSRLLTNRPVRHHQKSGSGTLRRLGVASGQHLNKRLW